MEKDNVLLDSLIREYWQHEFLLRSEKKELETEVLGFEKDDDEYVVYYESCLKRIPKTVYFKIRFLTNTFDDQVNIVHFQNGMDKQSFTLGKDKQEIELTIGPKTKK